MKRLCFLIVILCVTDIVKSQQNDYLVTLVEKSVIEYYDTLSASSVHRTHIQQLYRNGILCDTNIYLTKSELLSIIDFIYFLQNLQTPEKMPPKAFYHNGRKFQFMERTDNIQTFPWIFCHPPKINKKRGIPVIEITTVALNSDTLSINLRVCFVHAEKKLIKGRCKKILGFGISHGVKFKYIFSDVTKEWICVNKEFWGI